MGVWVVISLTKVDRDTTASTATVLLKVMDQRQDVPSWQSSGVALQEGAFAGACQILHAGNQLSGIIPAVLRDLLDAIGDVFQRPSATAQCAASAVDSKTTGIEFDCGVRVDRFDCGTRNGAGCDKQEAEDSRR